MKSLSFFGIFLLFIIYSNIGWLIEVVKTKIDDDKWINRGFLIGPYCPIYGFCSLVMAAYLTKYKSNIITVFILAFFICSLFEYLTSYFLEKIFNTRWWDYSNEKYNFEGRICLKNCIYFGLLGVLLVYFLNPALVNILKNMKLGYLNIISFIVLIYYLFDNIISIWLITKVKSSHNKTNIDRTEEMNKKINNIFKAEKKKLQKRIIKAFPNLKNIIKI